MYLTEVDSNTAKFWRITKGALAPVRMTRGSVGYDVRAAETYIIEKGGFAYIRTGLVVKPPEGYHIELALRSSLPKKKGLLIPNGLGIIDQDYTGPEDEICVPIWKFGFGSEDTVKFINEEGIKEGEAKNGELFGAVIDEGDRIAQLVFRKTELPVLEDCTGKPFEDSSRGGFGSTDE